MRTFATLFYFVFPNTIVAVHPDWVSHITMTSETASTSIYTHGMLVPRDKATNGAQAHWLETWGLIEDNVLQVEDLAVAESIRSSLSSGAVVDREFRIGGLEMTIRWFYAVLQRRAMANTELAAALAPVAAFFAYRHATVKAAGTPTRPQLKATKKALKTLKKQAPQLLAAGAGQGATASAPLASAIPAQPTGQGAPVPAPVGGAGGSSAPGVVTSTPAAPGAATHS